MNFGAIEIIWNDEYKLDTVIKLQAKDKEGKIVIERNITLNELQQYYLRNRIKISIILLVIIIIKKRNVKLNIMTKMNALRIILKSKLRF